MVEPVDDGTLEFAQDPTQRIIAVIGDAFAFVRSREANKALATVTLEELIEDQIKRNGESNTSRANAFTPYSYTPSKDQPAGTEAPRANFASGVDASFTAGEVSQPTKLDFILAVQNELTAVIKEIKENPIPQIKYTESVQNGFAEEDVTEGEG